MQVVNIFSKKRISTTTWLLVCPGQCYFNPIQSSDAYLYLLKTSENL